MNDRSTEEFVLALKRFCNRRSTPSTIHSDNAGEFICGKNTINNVFEQLNTYKTHQKLQDELQITWYHSPSRSPSHNGVIESIVKITKQPLYKCLNGRILSEMDFYTLLTDIEATLNSRPLAGISENADDGNILPITPSHLIIGRSLKPLPTEIYKGVEEPRKNVHLKERWKLRHQIMERFWNSWKKEYLTELKKYTSKHN